MMSSYTSRLVLLIWFLFLSFASAGSSDAIIRGETSSKRTQVELHVGDVTGLIREVALTIDGQSYTFVPERSTVIKDEESQVYVLIADHEAYEFKMWMIPGSEKVKSKTAHGLKSSFAAIIEATDPRGSSKWKMTPRITIGCTLDYAL